MSNEWYDIDSWQWVGVDTAQWGFDDSVAPAGQLYQIWTDADYVYAATSSGLDIIDLYTETRVSFASGNYKSVWADDTDVYIASSAGLKKLSKSNIGPEDVSSYLTTYLQEPDLTSNNVRYVHGNSDRIICCTAAGVDIHQKTSLFTSHCTVSSTGKCFVTPDYNYFYYTTSGTPHKIHRVDNNMSDWTTADRIYPTTVSGFLLAAEEIKDIFVTEHTSLSGTDNTLFVATDIGVIVYDEGSGDYDTYTSILAGTSTNYTSVWADPTANIQNARMYVGTKGTGAALSVVDLEHQILVDSYLIDQAGEYDEQLDREDIEDINVSTAGS